MILSRPYKNDFRQHEHRLHFYGTRDRILERMSVYGQIPRRQKIDLDYLPISGQLKKSGTTVLLTSFDTKYEIALFAIFKDIIDDGQTYPLERVDTMDDFRSYFLSHDCFVCVDADSDEVYGGFYVKPNFPGRSSHICNAGFIVKQTARQMGVGSFMAGNYLQIARDLGYEGSFFNLVFLSNPHSLKIWDRLGFTKIGTVPKAGWLKGLGYVDANQYYYDLTTLSKTQES